MCSTKGDGMTNDATTLQHNVRCRSMTNQWKEAAGEWEGCSVGRFGIVVEVYCKRLGRKFTRCQTCSAAWRAWRAVGGSSHFQTQRRPPSTHYSSYNRELLPAAQPSFCIVRLAVFVLAKHTSGAGCRL